jgi:uncharacterized repeat protein (TIGR01451 family)
MNLGSVPGFDLTGAAPDPGHRCQAPARRGAPWLCRGRGLALALALLAVVAASAGGPPVLAAAQPAADLVVTMIATPVSVPVGGRIEYRMAVTNQGPNLASNVILKDALPTGMEFVSASTTQGNSFLSLRTLVCDLGALDVGDTAVVDMVVTATVAGTFVNVAVVNSDTPDPNLDNNGATYPASAGPQAPPPPPSPSPPSPCAVDQTSAFKVIPGMLEYVPSTRRFLQPVQLANITKQPITGPFWLVLDGLAPVVLTNADGQTACQPPLGSPYLQINVGLEGVLRPGKVVTMSLSFAIPSGHGLVYHTRVLTGIGER